MRRLSQFTSVLSFALILSGSAVLAQAPAAPATVALVKALADGRVTYDIVTTKRASMWIAEIPRIDGVRPLPDVPQSFVLQFSRVLVGRDVHVDISALSNQSRKEWPITSVVVSPGARLVVNELERFGVKAIELSLAEVDPVTPYLPTVISPSPNVEVSNVEILTVPYPGYRISLRNLSDKPAASLEVQSYRGEEKAISSSPRGQNGRAAMTPGATFTFTLGLVSGSSLDITPRGHVAPQPLDVIDINAVRWSDGTIEGVSRFPGVAAVLPRDGGRRLQLTRIIDIYKRALAGSVRGAAALESTRQHVEALADFESDQLPEALTSMVEMKRAAIADLNRFSSDRVASNDAAAVRLWMLVAVERYEDWLARLAR